MPTPSCEGAPGWLESFLATYPGAVVVVSPDLELSSRVVTRVVELDLGRVRGPPGG